MITFRLIELGPSPDGSEEWTWRIERDGTPIAEARRTHHTLADCQNDVSALINELSEGEPDRVLQMRHRAR
jgi:hypothetical protein